MIFHLFLRGFLIVLSTYEYIYGYIILRQSKFCHQFRLLIKSQLLDMFLYGQGMGWGKVIRVRMGGMVILSSWEKKLNFMNINMIKEITSQTYK